MTSHALMPSRRAAAALFSVVMTVCGLAETAWGVLDAGPSGPQALPSLSGTIEVPVARLRVDRPTALVSSGVPFAPGQLFSERNVAILLGGQEIAIGTKILARWPQDSSIRSLLVQFPLRMDTAQQPVTLQWGRPRSTKDVPVRLVEGDFPEALMMLPARWLCDSQVIGEQVPLYDHAFSDYDKRVAKFFPKRRDDPQTGDIRTDGYYSTPHVFYQLYLRSGDLDMFMAARRELLAYRDHDIILEGPLRGGHTTYRETRYVYVEALADDYLLTGDERSRTVASYMVEYLTSRFPAEKAFYPHGSTVFWTEREAAFPFLGVLAYYEISGDETYRKIADAYMANLYKTQLEWPGRGGFIHNLYAHDPTEHARQDEWGGSPFMTGLLLEAVVKYHQLTGSDTAARSLFLALDWLKGEALAPDGASFRYLTADHYNENGSPDLNLLIAHAFGYGYKISGYKRTDYLTFGEKIFKHGVDGAFLEDRKHFNQNYRSSGHFLAYLVKSALVVPAPSSVPQPLPEPADPTTLFRTDFESGVDGWLAPVRGIVVEQDATTAFTGTRSLRVRREPLSLELSVAKRFEEGWTLAQHPHLRFAYRIPHGVSVGVRCLTTYGDWVYLGGTAGQPRDGATGGEPLLRDDDAWHEVTFNAADDIHRVLAGIEVLTEFQFFSQQKATTANQFWVDAFSITQ